MPVNKTSTVLAFTMKDISIYDGFVSERTKDYLRYDKADQNEDHHDVKEHGASLSESHLD